MTVIDLKNKLPEELEAIPVDSFAMVQDSDQIMDEKFQTKPIGFFKDAMIRLSKSSVAVVSFTLIGLLTGIMGGSLVIEKMFAVPGMGGQLVDSIMAGDHFLTVALLIFYSAISLVTILIVDLSYGIIDPRIRVGGGNK